MKRRSLPRCENGIPQGVAVKEPRYWQDAAFNNPSQPVVGICWYEAIAYANWLAAVTGQPYRLPTEPEWEWAARRGGRQFPWGSGWDTTRLNSLEGDDRVMRTTPVGAYPQGATPDGIYDLAGNVWEWTATRYANYPYQSAANLEDPDCHRAADRARWGLGGEPQDGAVCVSGQRQSRAQGQRHGISPRQDLSLGCCPLSPVPCPLIWWRAVVAAQRVLRPAGPLNFCRQDDLWRRT